MTAYLALESLKPKQTRHRGPLQADRLDRDPARPPPRGEDQGPRPALRAAAAERQRRRPDPGRRRRPARFRPSSRQMNQAAQALGLANTSYANPIGLDSPDNYSSARDLVTLADLLLKNRLFARIVDSPERRPPQRRHAAPGRHSQHPAQPGALHRRGEDRSHDQGRLRPGRLRDQGLDHPDLSGARRPERGRPRRRDPGAPQLRLLAVPILGARSSRESSSPTRSSTTATSTSRWSPSAPCGSSTREGQRVATSVDAPDEVSGAVEKGEELGQVVVTVDGKQAASSPLVAAEAVEAATLMDKARLGRPEADCSPAGGCVRDSCRPVARCPGQAPRSRPAEPSAKPPPRRARARPAGAHSGGKAENARGANAEAAPES